VPQTAAVQHASILVSSPSQLKHGRLRSDYSVISSDVITAAVSVADAAVCSIFMPACTCLEHCYLLSQLHCHLFVLAEALAYD